MSFLDRLNGVLLNNRDILESLNSDDNIILEAAKINEGGALKNEDYSN